MNSLLAEPAWWQRLPDCLAEHRDAVLVTVARVEGSAPREAGATLLVEADRCTDTIGGGNLEYQAIATARRLLSGEDVDSMVPYTLGPGLRQCCGGAVWLLYERVQADQDSVLRWRALRHALQQGARVLRDWSAVAAGSSWRALSPSELQGPVAKLRAEPIARAQVGQHWQQLIGATGFPVRLFGAGHVGRALARVLAGTEARLQWIDARPECAADAQRMGLPLRVCAEPLEAVEDALPGTWFIVMTHSHTLDFELVEAILRRRDARFCGLIGSATKAARFRNNLRRQGVDDGTIARLTCPIGVPGIQDKLPSVIAISIAAQLLQAVEASRHSLSPPSQPRVAINEFSQRR